MAPLALLALLAGEHGEFDVTAPLQLLAAGEVGAGVAVYVPGYQVPVLAAEATVDALYQEGVGARAGLGVMGFPGTLLRGFGSAAVCYERAFEVVQVFGCGGVELGLDGYALPGGSAIAIDAALVPTAGTRWLLSDTLSIVLALDAPFGIISVPSFEGIPRLSAGLAFDLM